MSENNTVKANGLSGSVMTRQQKRAQERKALPSKGLIAAPEYSNEIAYYNLDKFAPVAPAEFLLRLKEEQILGRYHLLLAHDVVECAAAHKKVWGDFRYVKRPGTIIMDNSVIELGKPVDYKMILEAHRIVPSDVLVMPDFIGDAKLTVEAHKEASAKLLEQKILRNPAFMFIPQGKDIPEVLQCMEELTRLPNMGMIGIPRDFVKYFGSRIEVTRSIMRLNEAAKRVPYHMLGFSDFLADDILCAQFPRVWGIDSAVPVRMGLQNKRLSIVPFDTGPRGDYWKLARRKKVNADVRFNLTWIRSWASHNINVMP